MKYTIRYSNKFKKSIKRCEKRGLNLLLLQKAIQLLGETGTLPSEYHPHKLSGSHNMLWECHIQADWLLIWEEIDQEVTLILTDTGTHSDLF